MHLWWINIEFRESHLIVSIVSMSGFLTCQWNERLTYCFLSFPQNLTQGKENWSRGSRQTPVLCLSASLFLYLTDKLCRDSLNRSQDSLVYHGLSLISPVAIIFYSLSLLSSPLLTFVSASSPWNSSEFSPFNRKQSNVLDTVPRAASHVNRLAPCGKANVIWNVIEGKDLVCLHVSSGVFGNSPSCDSAVIQCQDQELFVFFSYSW